MRGGHSKQGHSSHHHHHHYEGKPDAHATKKTKERRAGATAKRLQASREHDPPSRQPSKKRLVRDESTGKACENLADRVRQMREMNEQGKEPSAVESQPSFRHGNKFTVQKSPTPGPLLTTTTQ